LRASFASLVHRRRLVRSMGGDDPLVLLTLAALGGASGHSPSSPPHDHRSCDRRYSDRRYSIASPASENRLIVVIAASTRPDHLLSSSPMRSTGGERSRSSSSRSLLLAARPGALIRVQRPKIKVYCCVAVSAYRMSSCHFATKMGSAVLGATLASQTLSFGERGSSDLSHSKRVLSGGFAFSL